MDDFVWSRPSRNLFIRCCTQNNTDTTSSYAGKQILKTLDLQGFSDFLLFLEYWIIIPDSLPKTVTQTILNEYFGSYYQECSDYPQNTDYQDFCCHTDRDSIAYFKEEFNSFESHIRTDTLRIRKDMDGEKNRWPRSDNQGISGIFFQLTGSSAEVVLSQTSSFGLPSKIWAMPGRCFIPLKKPMRCISSSSTASPKSLLQ